MATQVRSSARDESAAESALAENGTARLIREFGRSQRIGPSACFLCGRRLGSRNRSDEHVIPQWVQKRFRLRDARLNLLNGTSIPYRQLTIPCCVRCNTVHLSSLEKDVKRAVFSGASAVQALPDRTLFIWLGKIFYGLLMREHLLQCDRLSENRRSIVPKRLLRKFARHHSFLQAARLPVQFSLGVPASILVVPVQCPDEVELQFDFRDSFGMLTIAVRLGAVGIVASLQDGGWQRDNLFPMMNDLRSHAHHPLQFNELTAQFFYNASRLSRRLRFLIRGSRSEVQVIQVPRNGGEVEYDEWDPEKYARVLADVTGWPLEQLFHPPRQVRMWSRNANLELVQMPLSEFSWP